MRHPTPPPATAGHHRIILARVVVISTVATVTALTIRAWQARRARVPGC